MGCSVEGQDQCADILAGFFCLRNRSFNNYWCFHKKKTSVPLVKFCFAVKLFLDFISPSAGRKALFKGFFAICSSSCKT
jgi:hypothetical protein